MTVLARELDGLLPAGVRLLPSEAALGGNAWVCDCGDMASFYSQSVELLMADYRKHLNIKHRRR
jgi:hypothetical protein